MPILTSACQHDKNINTARFLLNSVPLFEIFKCCVNFHNYSFCDFCIDAFRECYRLNTKTQSIDNWFCNRYLLLTNYSNPNWSYYIFENINDLNTFIINSFKLDSYNISEFKKTMFRLL